MLGILVELNVNKQLTVPRQTRKNVTTHLLKVGFVLRANRELFAALRHVNSENIFPSTDFNLTIY